MTQHNQIDRSCIRSGVEYQSQRCEPVSSQAHKQGSPLESNQVMLIATSSSPTIMILTTTTIALQHSELAESVTMIMMHRFGISWDNQDKRRGLVDSGTQQCLAERLLNSVT